MAIPKLRSQFETAAPIDALVVAPEAFVARKKSFFAIELLENRFPALHGLRVLAVLAVVISHNFHNLSPQDLALNRSITWMSMDFFFIMSGFLVGSILLHSSGENGWRYFGRFYLRRSFRLFPLYYFTLALLVALQARVSGLEAFRPTLWREIFFLTNYPSLNRYYMNWSWSLSLEEHCYLVSPFLVAWLSRVQKVARLPALIMLFLLPLGLRVTALQSQPDFFIGIFTPTHLRFDSFMMGVTIAYLRKSYPLQIARWASRPSATRICFVAGLALMLLMVCTFSLPMSYQPILCHPLLAVFYSGTLVSIAFGLFLFWAIYDKGRLNNLAGSKPFQIVAALGYGIYLIHFPMYDFFNAKLPDLGWYPKLFLVTLASATFAYAMHICVEKPFLRLRERLVPAKPSTSQLVS